MPPCRFPFANGESEIGAGLLLQMEQTEARPACAAVTAIGKEKQLMSKTSGDVTKADALAQVQALIAGTNKHFPNGSFTLGNVAYTTATLLQVLQSLVDAMTTLAAAQLSAKDALAAEQAVVAKVSPVIQAYKRFLHATFTGATQPLADFGLEPPKAPAPRTAEEKAAAAAKARATRAARGTTSKKQKLAIKGDVTGITVTPVTSTPAATSAPATPAAPATPSQPAPTASSEPAPAAPPAK
jgi:hypothetical protein